jgi:hypothetical protein
VAKFVDSSCVKNNSCGVCFCFNRVTSPGYVDFWTECPTSCLAPALELFLGVIRRSSLLTLDPGFGNGLGLPFCSHGAPWVQGKRLRPTKRGRAKQRSHWHRAESWVQRLWSCQLCPNLGFFLRPETTHLPSIGVSCGLGSVATSQSQDRIQGVGSCSHRSSHWVVRGPQLCARFP